MFVCPNLPKEGYSWNSSLAAPTQGFQWANTPACLNGQVNPGALSINPLLLAGQEDEQCLFTGEAHAQGLLSDLITTTSRWMGGFPRQPQCIQKNRQPDLLLPSPCWCKGTFAELSSFPSNIFFFHLPHCFLWIWAKWIHGPICYSSTDNATDVLIYTTWLLLCIEPIQSKLSNPFTTK